MRVDGVLDFGYGYTIPRFISCFLILKGVLQYILLDVHFNNINKKVFGHTLLWCLVFSIFPGSDRNRSDSVTRFLLDVYSKYRNYFLTSLPYQLERVMLRLCGHHNL